MIHAFGRWWIITDYVPNGVWQGTRGFDVWFGRSSDTESCSLTADYVDRWVCPD